MLRELVGFKVAVWTGTGQTESKDVGVMERVEDGWIRLRKSETEVLYLNINCVRLIKSAE